MQGPRTADRWAWWIAGAAAAAMALPWIGLALDPRRILWCEGPGISNLLSISLSHLLEGEIPLWTFYQNAGQPLWPILESHFPACDPVLLAAGLPLAALGADAHAILLCVLGAWFAIFLAGIYRLGREEGLETPLALFATLAVASGLSHGLARNPFLFLHARYAPFLWLSLREFLRRPDLPCALRLAGIGVLSLSGANTPYLLIFLLSAALCFLAVHRAVPGRPSWMGLLAAGGALAAGAIPFLLTAWHLLHDASLASRLSAPYLWSPPLLLHLELFSWIPQGKDEIGSAHAGLAGALLALAGSAAALVARKSSLEEEDLPPLRRLRFWTLLLVLMAVLTFSTRVARLGSGFLAMRNFGFFLPYVGIALALSAALSLQWLFRKADSLWRDARFWGCVVAVSLPLTAFYATFPLSRRLLPTLDPAYRAQLAAGWAILLVKALALLVAMMWLLKRVRAASPSPPPALLNGLLLAGAASFAAFAHGSRSPYGVQADPDVRRRAPVPRRTMGLPPFERRAWEPFLPAYLPFLNEAPAAFRVPAAFLPPVIEVHGYRATNPTATHILRTRRYQALLDSGIPPERIRQILGVDRDLAWVSSRDVRVRDLPGALSALRRAPPVVLDRAVLVETSEAGEADPAWPPADAFPPPPSDGIRRTILSTSAFRLEGSAPEGGWIVISEGYDPAWEASLNGSPVGISPAFVATMAVPVGKGPFSIELRFRPRLYIAGWWIRLLVHAAVAIAAVRAAGRWLLRSRG